MTGKKKVELLAPAGNYESFIGAIHAGADAIYLGGEKFGARAYADNFGTEELCECLRYAHLFGRKVYLTINTLVKEKELQELFDYLYPFYCAGLDGVIVQDMGVFQYVKQYFPGLELHVSTQMTITGVNGAKKLKQLGASRIVPARELSLQEIRLIKEEADIEIETFIHGAMCYCYSGQCLFSSIVGGRSGNRGRCAQPCRLPYKVSLSKKEAYYLSLKDMCTIEMIPELIEAGIDSFKIEGRMKKPEYAAGVTAMYRKYIDLYYKNGKDNYCIAEKDMEQLRNLYIRSEIHDGYYNKHNGASMITIDKPSYSGSDEQLLSYIRKKYIDEKKKIQVRGTVRMQIGAPAQMSLDCCGVNVIVDGAVVAKAQKQPLQYEAIKKQLSKCGNTVFVMETLDIQMDEDVFMTVKELNELRRAALLELENKLIAENGFAYPERIRVKKEENCIGCAPAEVKKMDLRKGVTETQNCAYGFYVSVQTKEQLDALCETAKQYPALQAAFLSTDIFSVKDGNVERDNVYNKVMQLSEKLPFGVFAVYPYVFRSKDIWLHACFSKEKIFSGIVVRNMEEMSLLHNDAYDGKIVTDAGLYIWNSWDEQFFETQADLGTFPIELNAGEKSGLSKQNKLQIVYGRVPMMITANCLKKTTGNCQKELDGKAVILTDRVGKKFPVFSNCRHCYNVIYNSVVLSLHKKIKEKEGMYRLDFTTESKEETKKVLNFFCEGKWKDGANPPYAEYTTGHEKRGVE